MPAPLWKCSLVARAGCATTCAPDLPS